MKWTIEKIESCGFTLLTMHKQWCHFRGNGFDVFTNLNGNGRVADYFNFRSLGGRYNGNFKARVGNVEEMNQLLNFIQWDERL